MRSAFIAWRIAIESYLEGEISFDGIEKDAYQYGSSITNKASMEEAKKFFNFDRIKKDDEVS